MPPLDPLLPRTRRHFFRECGVGLGSIALASLLNGMSSDGACSHASVCHPREAGSRK